MTAPQCEIFQEMLDMIISFTTSKFKEVSPVVLALLAGVEKNPDFEVFVA